MNYCLCKICFLTPLHAGKSDSAKSLDGSEIYLCADTLFSALCCTAETYSGGIGAKELCSMAAEGAFFLSDMMPYHEDDLFVPRPSVLPEVYKDNGLTDKKLIKNLKYIPLGELPDFFAYITEGAEFTATSVFTDFGIQESVEKVSIRGMEASSPYSVGTFTFNSRCGLYFLIASPNEAVFDRLIKLVSLLGYNGIGGKVSSGYGKFTFLEDPYFFDDNTEEEGQIRLFQRMLSENSPYYMSITTSLPNDEELAEALNGSFYTVRRRGGFVQSSALTGAVKKDSQFFLAAGSIFRSKYNGALYSVARGENHPIYRYSKPLFLGVDYR